jgi:hypothetical protein
MAVRGAAAETTVAVTPTAPMESGRSAVEPDVGEDSSETEEVELGTADMATSMLQTNGIRFRIDAVHITCQGIRRENRLKGNRG